MSFPKALISLSAVPNPLAAKLGTLLIIVFAIALAATLILIPVIYTRRMKERSMTRRLSGHILRDPELAQSIKEHKTGKQKDET